VTTLRLVRDEPPQRPKRRRRPPLFDEAQNRALRASLRTLQGSFGTWRRLASAMDMRANVLIRAAGKNGRVSAEMAIRASRAARQPLEALLSPGPRPA
jgi:hypothetical protein